MAGFDACGCSMDGSAGETDDRFFEEDAGPLE
jgi:hypothetical protein